MPSWKPHTGMLGPTKLRVCLTTLLEGVQQNGGPSFCCWASSFGPLLMSTQISQRWPKESRLFVWIWRTPECCINSTLVCSSLIVTITVQTWHRTDLKATSAVPSLQMSPGYCLAGAIRLCPPLNYSVSCTGFVRAKRLHLQESFESIFTVGDGSAFRWTQNQLHLTSPNHRAQEDNDFFSKVKRMPPRIYLSWNSMRKWVY